MPSGIKRPMNSIAVRQQFVLPAEPDAKDEVREVSKLQPLQIYLGTYPQIIDPAKYSELLVGDDSRIHKKTTTEFGVTADYSAFVFSETLKDQYGLKRSMKALRALDLKLMVGAMDSRQYNEMVDALRRNTQSLEKFSLGLGRPCVEVKNVFESLRYLTHLTELRVDMREVNFFIQAKDKVFNVLGASIGYLSHLKILDLSIEKNSCSDSELYRLLQGAIRLEKLESVSINIPHSENLTSDGVAEIERCLKKNRASKWCVKGSYKDGQVMTNFSLAAG